MQCYEDDDTEHVTDDKLDEATIGSGTMLFHDGDVSPSSSMGMLTMATVPTLFRRLLRPVLRFPRRSIIRKMLNREVVFFILAVVTRLDLFREDVDAACREEKRLLANVLPKTTTETRVQLGHEGSLKLRCALPRYDQ